MCCYLRFKSSTVICVSFGEDNRVNFQVVKGDIVVKVSQIMVVCFRRKSRNIDGFMFLEQTAEGFALSFCVKSNAMYRHIALKNILPVICMLIV